MEISRHQQEGFLEVRVSGRLDSHWADFLAEELSEIIQQGEHTIQLDLAEVHYLSSAGIAVLLRFHKELAEIDGSLLVSNASEMVSKVFEISGLARTLLLDSTKGVEPEEAEKPSVKELDREGVLYQIYESAPGESLQCRVIGDPLRLAGCRFEDRNCQTVTLKGSSFGLGIGALGPDFASCRDRFGELLAVAGTAIYQPTDGTGAPDYLVSAGDTLPEISVLYGLICDGRFSLFARFETSKEKGPVSLSSLAGSCLEMADTDRVGMVIVSESVGLVGAALKRSPALEASPEAPFEHPGIRRWLSFTPERVYTRSVNLIVGLAIRGDAGELDSFVRPFGQDPGLAGHLHAAAFTYGPVKRGEIKLRETVSTLFRTERPLGVLHLLHDRRPILGVGESEFSRGACWFGPISNVSS